MRLTRSPGGTLLHTLSKKKKDFYGCGCPKTRYPFVALQEFGTLSTKEVIRA